jgi:hypothetical protein
MNIFFHHKIVAAAFCVSAAAAFFAGTPVAHAASVFPPEHLAPGTEFAPADPFAAQVQPGPWYRYRAPASSDRRAVQRALPGVQVSAEFTVTPWYRAAN